jgi:protease-4
VLALLGLPGCITVNLLGLGPGELEESVVAGERGPKILLLDIDGLISEASRGSRFGLRLFDATTARVREQLDRAERDDEIRGLLLRINSPGGTASASEVVYREILRFKQKQGIPVVAQLMGTAASGGYYVAMAADVIYAQPTSVTGSIGVLLANVSVAGLMEKLGIEDQTLTSGPYKDAGSPLRRLRPEEREQLQSVVDDLHARFREVVGAGRPALDAERVSTLADGRIYSAGQALELGLIDGIATLPETVRALERRAGLEASRVVSYHRPGEWRANLYSVAPAPEPPSAELGTLLGLGPQPAFLYLWWPGATQ